MAKTPKPGDKVEWSSSQGKIEGVVEKKITRTTKIKGFTAKATPDDPKLIVKSSKTGAKAAHKPGSLKPKG